MNLNDIPDGLGAMQYGAKLCEDLGLPAKSNVPMIGEAIEAVAKSQLFRGRDDAMKLAFYWLYRRTMTAKGQGQRINTLWFAGGNYWDVEQERPQPAGPQRFEHHGQGYNAKDMQDVYAYYEKKIRAAGKHVPMTDELMNELLDKVDKKRGGSPSWRSNAR